MWRNSPKYDYSKLIDFCKLCNSFTLTASLALVAADKEIKQPIENKAKLSQIPTGKTMCAASFFAKCALQPASVGLNIFAALRAMPGVSVHHFLIVFIFVESILQVPLDFSVQSAARSGEPSHGYNPACHLSVLDKNFHFEQEMYVTACLSMR